MTIRGWQWVCFTVIVAAYIGSLTMPAERTWSIPEGALTELDIIVLWWNSDAPGSQFWSTVCVSPNVLLIIGVVVFALRRHWTAMVLGLAASLLACLWFMDWPGLKIGYFLWLGSMMLLAASGAFLGWISAKDVQRTALDMSLPGLPDQSVSALFNNPPAKHPPVSKDVVSGPIQDDPSSSLQK